MNTTNNFDSAELTTDLLRLPESFAESLTVLKHLDATIPATKSHKAALTEWRLVLATHIERLQSGNPAPDVSREVYES